MSQSKTLNFDLLVANALACKNIRFPITMTPAKFNNSKNISFQLGFDEWKKLYNEKNFEYEVEYIEDTTSEILDTYRLFAKINIDSAKFIIECYCNAVTIPHEILMDFILPYYTKTNSSEANKRIEIIMQKIYRRNKIKRYFQQHNLDINKLEKRWVQIELELVLIKNKVYEKEFPELTE